MNDLQKYSADWVREEVKRRGASLLLHHDCSLCGYPTAYHFGGPFAEVVFDAGCDCTHRSSLREASYDAIADWLAMQSSDDIREAIMSGLRPRLEDAVKDASP